MFELEKTYTFEACHYLAKHQGKCRNVHGHSYTMTVKLRGPTLHSEGPFHNMMHLDLHDLDQFLLPMIEQYFDHQSLNDSLQCESPTLEFMTQWVFRRLKSQIPCLSAIRIQEGPTLAVTYTE